ncbi:uncharacterized protein BDV17DRAFT_291714 [Aspergillus undulatus]|uniref:uncharacterized protein n=1 Tax=Aspergillus undulatus TaxID=1810928 RepID=UPI003CCD20F3
MSVNPKPTTTAMPCNPHNWLEMCRECKELTTKILDTGNAQSQSTYTWTPRRATLQPERTTPVIFDLEAPARELDTASEGGILGNAVQDSLERFIRFNEDDCMRFHMWIRRLEDDLVDSADTVAEPGPAGRTRERERVNSIALAAAETEAAANVPTGAIKISVLVDVPSKRPPIASMRQGLPRTLTIEFPDGEKDTVAFENPWTVRPGICDPDGNLEYPGMYRLQWFAEIMSSSGPYLVWSNFSLWEQISKGHIGLEKHGENLFYEDGPEGESV